LGKDGPNCFVLPGSFHDLAPVDAKVAKLPHHAGWLLAPLHLDHEVRLLPEFKV
jgi:hypothetical protein